MSYLLKAIKDHPIGFWPLDESSGLIAYDVSPCGNNSTYTGSLSTSRMPLVSGGQYGTKIDSTNYISYSVNNNYQGTSSGGSFAKQDYSDNDFSLECWFYPLNMDSTYQVVFGDSNQCSIQANNSNIQFHVHDEIIQYTIPNQKKNTHIVATYHPGRMSLYIDGMLANSKYILDFKFLNESLNIQSKATGSSSFLIDAPAIYRYELTNAIVLDHYNSNTSIEPIHIVTPDGGSLIEFYDNNIATKFKYLYPSSKPWQELVADGLVYNSDQDSLQMRYVSEGGTKEVEVVEFISIPIDIYNIAPINKIQWISSLGISVYISYDGETYTQCINGKANQITSNDFYLKIKFTSSNASEFIPSISSLAIKLISSDLTMYSKNTGAYVDNFINSSILDKYPVMQRNSQSGVFCSSSGTFDIHQNFSVNSIEFLYTPYLVSGTRSASFPAGNIYVNGILKTGSNMSDLFNVGEMHHVVINTSAISSLLNFNASGNSALFQHIALYANQLNAGKILNHYNLYIGRPSISVSESSFSVTENLFKAYNNNWMVIQNS
jgi:hypothetical protein